MSIMLCSYEYYDDFIMGTVSIHTLLMDAVNLGKFYLPTYILEARGLSYTQMLLHLGVKNLKVNLTTSVSTQ